MLVERQESEVGGGSVLVREASSLPSLPLATCVIWPEPWQTLRGSAGPATPARSCSFSGSAWSWCLGLQEPSETVRHIEDQMMRTDSVSPLSSQSDCCMYQLLTTKGIRFLLVLTTAPPAACLG